MSAVAPIAPSFSTAFEMSLRQSPGSGRAAVLANKIEKNRQKAISEISKELSSESNVIDFMGPHSKRVADKRSAATVRGSDSARSDRDFSARLTDLIAQGLARAFDECDLPEEERIPLVANIAQSLLQPARVARRIPLPETAPAIWKDDKLPGDTPPDFIQRHYADVLRADGTGLTRPDLRRLDPSLYMSLANWLRANEMPDECPLPTKSEALDRVWAGHGIDDVTRRELRRRESADRRGKQR